LSVAFGVGIGLLYEGLTNPLPTRVAAGGGWLRGLEQFLVRAGLRDVTARDFLLFSLGSGAVGGLAAQLFLGWGVVTLLAVGLGVAAPFLYYVRRHDRRRAAVQGALADAIAQLRDSIRTGLSVQDALTGLARNGPVALRPEFATLVREMRLLGFEPALAALRHRLADPVVDMVVAALVLNDRLGGRNVSQVLDRLAHATRAQLQIRGDVRAQQARNVLSARVVAAMPLVVLIAVRRVNPGYLALFDSWWGQALLAGCLVSITVGYVTMLLLTRLPEDDRLVGA
jgi:tight adherence protein B